MSLVLNEKYINGNDSYKLFLGNRILKIYPTYWAVLIFVCVVSLGIHFFDEFKNSPFNVYNKYDIGPTGLLVMILSNILILGQETMLFLGLNTETGSLFFAPDFSFENTTGLNSFIIIPQGWTIYQLRGYFLHDCSISM